MERVKNGQPPTPEGVSYANADAWNAKFAATAFDKDVADVLLDFDRSHADFIRAADRVPSERFQLGKTAWRMVDLNSAHHYREHGDQIRAWRRSRGI
jgi:predicted outer membrane protein